jgi:tRNA nucleotidyltransferase (CCA-adding enzyme)
LLPRQRITCLEGDAPSFARKLAKIKGFKVVSHPHFGTATVSRDVTSIDIVTARSETYLRPGALPTVKPGAIQDDLYRRDFTINAMAVYITPNRFGEVVDPYGGRIDIDNGVIRVLHDGSFTDDPTRIWRAIRYEQRLGFTLELETEELLRRDIPLMDRISGDRLRHELEGILLEDYPEKTICRADDLGVLKNLLPQLNGDNWLRGRFEKARKINPDSRIEHTLYYAVMSWLASGEGIH